jgi:predicted component of type VI protein secretion system
LEHHATASSSEPVALDNKPNPADQPGEGTTTPPILVLDTGQEIVVSGPGLVGRRPETDSSAGAATIVALEDPDRSISKTHLAIKPKDGTVWVTDLHSTNGTRVFSLAGGIRQLEPGVAVPVEPGETVQFGDRYFTVKETPN